jgi:hypothetical protein
MQYRFTLTYNGTDTVVTEPKDWKDFKSELKRDFNSHGVMFKFTSGTLKLGFADGRDVLEAAFQEAGYDAEVTFLAERRPDEYSTWVEVFLGEAVMSTRDYSDNYFHVDFDDSSMQKTVKNRMNTKVRLNTTKDLNGGDLNESLFSYTNEWTTIRLYDNYDATLSPAGVAGTLSTQGVTTVTSQDTHTLYAYWGYKGEIFNTMEEMVYKGVNIINVEDTPISEDTEPLMRMDFGGVVDFVGDVVFKIDMTSTFVGGATSVTLSYDIKIVQVRGGSEIDSYSIATGTYNDVTPVSPVTHTFDDGGNEIEVDYSVTFEDVNANDEFYILCEQTGTAVASTTNSLTSRFYLDPLNAASERMFINISQLRDSVAYDVKSWLIHDVFERVVYAMTGGSGDFYSQFFGNTNQGYAVDGCGSLAMLTSGGNFRDLDIYPSISFKELVDWASATFGVGWGFEKEYDGTYRVRVELMEHFYQDGEILDLGSPLSIKEMSSYEESEYTPLSINRVKVGYKKYSDEIGVTGSFEDFLTESTYSLPIKSNDGELSRISPFIASNELIQATYNKRGSGEKWKFDQNVFVVMTVRSGGGFVPENNENFESVLGVDDQDTAYNLRLPPVQMLLNHSLYINSSLFRVGTDRLIQNTEAKINQDFSTRYVSYATCLLSDDQLLDRTSVGDISIANNYNAYRLWNPIKHSLTVAMTSAQLQTLKVSKENASDDDSINLGYISYRDNDGNTKQGYVMDVKWGHIDEIAEIETLERADNYGI